jgi:hypothetical protein
LFSFWSMSYPDFFNKCHWLPVNWVELIYFVVFCLKQNTCIQKSTELYVWLFHTGSGGLNKQIFCISYVLLKDEMKNWKICPVEKKDSLDVILRHHYAENDMVTFERYLKPILSKPVLFTWFWPSMVKKNQ